MLSIFKYSVSAAVHLVENLSLHSTLLKGMVHGWFVKGGSEGEVYIFLLKVIEIGLQLSCHF